MDSEQHYFLQALKRQWQCPIFHIPMTEPVVAADGISYQKQAIHNWLFNQRKNTSPMTNLPLQNKNLVPNLTLIKLTQKLHKELPVFIQKEESLQTQLLQLKDEINFLRDQLKHEKEKNDEFIQQEEKEFKTKRIEKTRYESNYQQMIAIRNQKNQYQKQTQALRSVEQKQAREILQLKEQLRSMTEKSQVASGLLKKCFDLYKQVLENRDEVFEKLEVSFASNLTFIGHLLSSIQKARLYEDEKEHARVSQQTIAVEGNEGQANTYTKGVSARLQQLIRQTVNQAERNSLRQREKYRQIHRYYMRRAARRQNLLQNPSQLRENDDIYAGLTYSIHGRLFNVQQMIQDPQAQGANPNDQQNNPQPQNNISLLIQQLQQQNHARQPNNQHNNAHNQEDSDFYKQMLSIRWLMSKRSYKELTEFYSYRIKEYHNKKSTYWYGIKLSVLESRIPFQEFLPHSFRHVRWLDLSACNMDDEHWNKFIEHSHNFKCLMSLDLTRNKLQNIKREDLEKFGELVELNMKRNDFTAASLTEIRQYKINHPNIKVEFDDPQAENLHDNDWFNDEADEF